MSKDQTLKIRLSAQDIERLQYCKDATGDSMAETVRKGINKIYQETRNKERDKTMTKIYVEETVREDIGYRHVMTLDRAFLKEMLIHSGNNKTAAEREQMAEALISKIDAGQEVSIGMPYISKYRIATDEEIAEAAIIKKQDDVETDAICAPDVDAFIAKLHHKN